ncbi:MAG: 4'-phosphopantetheinyl transferase superfamily protein [Clostridia bacterium]|nr:4'-phosphopantetheinyl transferase superfamily protein [Clostridia bacterium]
MEKIKVYVLDISNRPFVTSKLDLVEEKRAENILNGKNYLHRLRSFYAGLLLRHAMICEGMNVNGRLPVEYNDYGKPYINGGKKFSITHAGNTVMVAVADVEVGLDAEIKQNKIYSEVSSKILTESEDLCYKSLEGKEKTEYFLTRWVAKEGYTKLLGGVMNKCPFAVEVGENDVNGCPYITSQIKYKNHLYFVSVVSRQSFETEFVYVSTLKTA